ncbi:MAG: ABC transporter ATP-binding protein [Gemmataceae bacterium]
MDIAVRNLVKTFGSIKALDGVSLSIPSGRKAALIGPNGSGKSTLTRILMGMLAYQGEVRLDGLSPFEQRVRLARRMAYVPQSAPQLAASVADIVRAVARIRAVDERRIAVTASQLDLDLGVLADRPIRSLSAGMKQKLLIALALSSRADLLILDEPTASLDVSARARFFSLFAEMTGAATLVLCSHRLEEIQHLVNHVIALDNGRVVFDGPVGAFLQTRAVSMMEIVTAAARHVDWLRARGFRPAAGASWVRSVTRVEKLALLGEIVTHFDGDLDNLVIRDVETLSEKTLETRL